jgi:hypothetical protein
MPTSRRNIMPFEPRTAIVTGSDSGIGRATAVALAEAGLDVGITWHTDRDGAERTADAVRAAGRRAVVEQLDASDAPRCAETVDTLADQLGRLDVFVNNAGTGANVPFLEMDYGRWRGIVATDLDGPFICLQRAARRMVAQGAGGRLIAVTSVHEHQPRVGSSAYDAAKHGLGGLIKTMALELGAEGITANSVAPGEIATPMTGQEDEDPRTVHRPRGRGRHSVPRLARVRLRDGSLVDGRRRDAADGSAGGVPPHRRRLARGVDRSGSGLLDASQKDRLCVPV